MTTYSDEMIPEIWSHERHAQHAVIDWYGRCARDLPWRHNTTTAWGILLSEVLSQQTQVQRAAEAWVVWIRRWPSARALAAATPQEVLEAWNNLGYPRRALRLREAAQRIVDEHNGVVPSRIDALEALPGIGTYTARAVASFAYGVRCGVVDTNVRRVLDRVIRGVSYTQPSSRDLRLMTTLLPSDDAVVAKFNAGMMELGATVCVNQQPRCVICPLQNWCAWKQRGYPASEVKRRRQPKFAGSLRQLRGKILRLIREAGASDLPTIEAAVDHDPRLDVALKSLIADGLLSEAEDSSFSFPDS